MNTPIPPSPKPSKESFIPGLPVHSIKIRQILLSPTKRYSIESPRYIASLFCTDKCSEALVWASMGFSVWDRRTKEYIK